ncbi:hypothetical protein O6H91_20G008800 [Diphasiastrum complanatum]|uniref:Uncharacterized protein n=1 Tax=Diphasiastrum complanatum TaxID=34168 RepID=A0ACC2APC1_DIPCM|nr:hypothetical protein O6H91_20G008800 [Diphasiastrum complanatum]
MLNPGVLRMNTAHFSRHVIYIQEFSCKNFHHDTLNQHYQNQPCLVPIQDVSNSMCQKSVFEGMLSFNKSADQDTYVSTFVLLFILHKLSCSTSFPHLVQESIYYSLHLLGI